MEKKEKRKPTGNYKVGFAAPPEKYRYPKGTCGNPKGRPKEVKVIDADSLAKLLFQPITIKKDGKPHKASPLETQVNSMIKKSLIDKNLQSIGWILKKAKQHGFLPTVAPEVAGGVVTLPRVVGAPQGMAFMLAFRFGVGNDGWSKEEIEAVRPDYELRQREEEETLRDCYREEFGRKK